MRLLFFLIFLLPNLCWGDSELTVGGKTAQAHLIEVSGQLMAPRPYLEITGDSVVGTDSGGQTVVTIPQGLPSGSALFLNNPGVGIGTYANVGIGTITPTSQLTVTGNSPAITVNGNSVTTANIVQGTGGVNGNNSIIGKTAAGNTFGTGQTFTLTQSTTITGASFTFSTNYQGSPSGTGALEIVTTSGGTPTITLANANATAPATYLASTTVSVSYTPFVLAAGQYCLYATYVAQSNGNAWTVASATGSPYSGGNLWYYSNGTWSDSGTTTMSNEFTIFGNTATQTPSVQFQSAGVQKGFIETNGSDNNNVEIGTTGTVLSITQGGNVGIGTTLPTHKLEVNGTSFLNGVTTTQNNTLDDGSGNMYVANALNTNNNFLDDGSGNGYIRGYLKTNYNTLDDANGNASFYGSVAFGINGASPNTYIDSNGSFWIPDGVDAQFHLQDDGGNDVVYMDSNGVAIGYQGSQGPNGTANIMLSQTGDAYFQTLPGYNFGINGIMRFNTSTYPITGTDNIDLNVTDGSAYFASGQAYINSSGNFVGYNSTYGDAYFMSGTPGLGGHGDTNVYLQTGTGAGNIYLGQNYDTVVVHNILDFGSSGYNINSLGAAALNSTSVTSMVNSGSETIVGNVGIGTTLPKSKLDIEGGNVGIGTYSNTGLLAIGGNCKSHAGLPMCFYDNAGDVGYCSTAACLACNKC